MRHVQRLGSGGRQRTIAGSLALVSGLALFSVARAPLAIGQLATVSVGNSGTGVASTGNNSATGNSSNNAIGSPGATTGGLVNADVGLGAPTNTSTGTATINTGTANASGNESQTGVNQATSGSGSPTFTPFNPFGGGGGSNQSATVSNDGIAAATTGGNNAVGNNSTNAVGGPDGTGAVDAVVGLRAPVNNSSGTAAITTGPANATGNTATTGVNQAKTTNDGSGGSGSGVGGGAGAGAPAGFFNATPFFPGTFPGTVNNFGSSFDPCSGRFFPFNPFANSPSGQAANVDNNGNAIASTGNNTAIGNNSTNTQTINQTASGGLIGLNVNLGSPTNNSTGTATINTGAANASGNQSSTTVNQFCGQVPSGGGSGSGAQPMIRNPITGNPIVVSPIATPVVVTPAVQTGTLARTGFESGLALFATALVLAGMALLVTARRKLSPVHFAGGVSSTEWDTVVRW